MYDTSIYLSLNCKLYAAKPSVITGFADSNLFLTLVSLWNFLGALTLCIESEAYILGSRPLSFRKVFRDRLCLPPTADIHYSVSPSYCFCHGGTRPEQSAGSFSLWPKRHMPPRVQHVLVPTIFRCLPIQCQLPQNHKTTVSNTVKGGTQGDEHQVMSTEGAAYVAQTFLFLPSEPKQPFSRRRWLHLGLGESGQIFRHLKGKTANSSR